MDLPVSEFKFENFFITESLIKRNPFIKHGNFSVNIIPKALINRKNEVYQLELNVQVSDDTNSFTANVTAFGLFKYSNNMSQEMLDNLFLVNAPAIIFPYIRAYISTLTGFSGIKAINLPIMNLVGLIEILKNNTTIITE